MVIIKKRGLPVADKFGNFWLGAPDGPAVFKSLRKKAHKKAGYMHDRYFATMGIRKGGVVMSTEEHGIKYFETPEDALQTLIERKAVMPGLIEL